MRTVPALALLLLIASSALAATPTVTSIEPNVGFVYTQTSVVIHGTEFSESDFDCTANPEPFCPSTVVFVVPVNGTLIELPATVKRATPELIEIVAPPRPNGTVADVKVRVQRKGEVVIERGFRWDDTLLSDKPGDYVRYLIPVTGRDMPGANGSLWTTEWTLHNAGSTFAMRWDNCHTLIEPCLENLVLQQSTHKLVPHPDSDGSDGMFVYVPKAVAGNIGMSLRVRDLSQNAQSFGTEIPIVSGLDYTGQAKGILRFIDIPTDPKYRATLRIYGPNEFPKEVTMSIFSESGQLLDRRGVDLQGVFIPEEGTIQPEVFPLHPSYAQLDPLTPAIRASGSRVRVEVVAFQDLLISPPLIYPLWGFVTVTNNETQQVTTITSSK